ncbi:MAG TPA: MscL family protein [Gemmatimonadaceae bacterium]|nr:MscL family protein [Gemmatimonadaceae bacterium]
MSMWREFKAFLLKENILALALAVVVGAATSKLVTAVVDDFVMPIVGVLTPGGAWQQWVTPGPVAFKVGDFLSALLNFFIIGFVAWRFARLFLKPTSAKAEPATKQCPFCRQTVDALATRCPYCTSELGAGAVVR